MKLLYSNVIYNKYRDNIYLYTHTDKNIKLFLIFLSLLKFNMEQYSNRLLCQ